MKLPIALALAASLVAFPAHAISLVISDADLSDGANLIGGGTKIKFPGTAVFDLNLTANQQYTITVTGQTNNSDSFFNFFIDPDGPGGLAETQLGGNFSFGNGFGTLSLPSFTASGDDFLRISSFGTKDNFKGQIEGVSIAFNAAPVPGPLVGAGLPGLVMALGGLIAWRRRRAQVAAV